MNERIQNKLLIEGTVVSSLLQNKDNGFGIIVIKLNPGDHAGQPYVNAKRQVKLVGPLGSVSIGDRIRCEGSLERHSSYGMQVKVDNYTVSQASDVAGIVAYLQSCVSKIGPVLAQQIADHFGADTLKVLDEDPRRVLEVPNVGRRRSEEIIKAWPETKMLRQINVFLSNVGVSHINAHKLMERYGEEAIEKIKADPYRLARDIDGFGFLKADEVAKRLGIPEISPIRIRAALEHILHEAASMGGHSFLYNTELVLQAVELLRNPEITEPLVKETLNHAVSQKYLVAEDTRVYSPKMHLSECEVASTLQQIISADFPQPFADADKEQILSDALQSLKLTPDPVQVDAMRKSLGSKVSVITGGPGTGKTTITKTLVAAYRQALMPVVLMAPTGRAAKRMSEVIGISAHTIHKVCHRLHGTIKKMIQDGESPQDAYERMSMRSCVIIVDEMSMVDIGLMQMLLSLCSNDVIMIFIGDQDQLPSVGPGAVLRDLVESESVPSTTLTKIFRQAEGSDIITNAHRINNGIMPQLHRMGREHGVPSTDMFAMVSDDESKLAEAAVYAATSFAIHLGFDPLADVHVMSPMYRGKSGVGEINARLQLSLNANPSDYMEFGQEVVTTWGVGDKIMQTKNNYEIDVFNGDIGRILSISRDDKDRVDSIMLRVNGEDVLVPKEHLGTFQLAYATTVHKAQGAQYPMVVMLLHTSHFALLQRNLLYTGITRAQKVVVLCCSEKAVHMAVNNNKVSKRNTYLQQRVDLVKDIR